MRLSLQCTLLLSSLVLLTDARNYKKYADDRRYPQNRTEFRHTCSRSVSRAVRRLVQQEVRIPASKAGVKHFPEGCPFEYSQDLWEQHELHKVSQGTHGKKDSSKGWKCGYCGKEFKNEYYLDLHMETRHMNETPSHNPVCLADYCGMFEVCEGDKKRSNSKSWKKGRSRPQNKVVECNEETIIRARRFCENALHKCFPIDDDATKGIHAQLSRSHCQVLDCRVRNERDNKDNVMPVLILIMMVGFSGVLAFGFVLCCVDHSDAILNWLSSRGAISQGCVKTVVKARADAHQAVGYTRVKGI